MYFEKIKQILYPRFENVSRWKLEEEIEKMRYWFESHCQIIANYILENENKLDNLDIDFFVQLHKLFYPVWFQIKAFWNDWVEHIMLPWKFRKQYLAKYITDFSKTLDIEVDFQKIIDDFNNIKIKTREDIFKFFLDFWKVHPFWDSNWTISIIISDILCFKYNYEPINTLNLRFKDKEYRFNCLKDFEKNKDLWEFLKKIDNFNKNN